MMTVRPFILSVILLFFPLDTPTQAQSDASRAEQLYLDGAKLLDHGDLADAEKNFAEARKLAPSRAEYAEAADLTRESQVAALLRESAKARIVGQAATADRLVKEASALDPHNEQVLQHLRPAQLAPAMEVVPSYRYTSDTERQVAHLAAPIEIASTPGKQNVHLRGTPADVVRQLLAQFGVKAVMDSSVPAVSEPIRFDIEGSDYEQANRVLLRMNHLFGVALDPHTLLIIKDTQENRAQFERLAEETIYVPGSTQEQLNEVQNIVRNVFDVTKIAVEAGNSALVVSAPLPTLKAVNYTLADLLDGGAQVMLEIQLISVDRMRERNVGFSQPSSISAFSIASEAQTIVNANESTITTAIQQGLFVPTGNVATDTLNEALYLLAAGIATDSLASGLIGTFGGGLTTGGVSLGSGATLNLLLNSSEAQALEDVTIRAGDRQQSVLRIGSKYPITTSIYSSGITAATTSALAGISVNGTSAATLLSQYLGSSSTTTIPQIQYEDLGLTLKTTPAVLKDGMVSINIDMKLEALTGQTNNNIPVLTSRAFTSTITVPEGTPAVLVSQVTDTESLAVSGLPGLASLPGFQGTLSDRDRVHDTTDLVVVVTPHLTRRRPSDSAGPRIAFQTSTPQEY